MSKNHWSRKHRKYGQGVLRKTSAVVKTMKSMGWCWGGDWQIKDYQHFEKHTNGCKRSGRYAVGSHPDRGPGLKGTYGSEGD
ncbi:MAG: hypothetical protein F2839_01755 [Actinobacteria bacterium]|nr:hypothetical protein [Actinomycetota bacterium]